ncbi:hypothetical protein [Caulobacter sp. 1776]|uniref:hypothetical protein n=1 Tax=Caulobacter sp. 1776 TaxID=3156420 RepID=UPI0033922216
MSNPTAKDAAEIVGYVGDFVGRTKLQKTAAILELAGLGAGFTFSYHLFGPYSEELSSAVDRAILLGLIEEDEKVATWGGRYSIFHAAKIGNPDPLKEALILRAANANSVVLELAVTAAFLAAGGEEMPWERVSALKSEKASAENMHSAKALYRELSAVKTPQPLPKFD